MRIGLSILTSAQHNIWSNGIGQNVYHLARLLEALPFVEQVVLIDTGDGGAPGDAGAIGARYAMLSPQEAFTAVDVAIEVSGGLGLDWLTPFRAGGGKAVFLNCGQPFYDLVEPDIFGRNDYFAPIERCDEIWLLPKDRAFTAMMRSLYRCPVHELPYLWSPMFLEQKVAELAEGGAHFGYREGMLAQGLRPALFEPNRSAGKMSTIPFLICETLEKVDPGRIAHLTYLNTRHMTEHPAFGALVGGSLLAQSGKVSLDGRQYVAKVLAGTANLVVSHQIDWGQNYLYLDVIHGDYPLIHNSPFFADVGYYYEGNDIAAGLGCLMHALDLHDQELPWHQARNRAKIASFSPENEANREAYAKRLLALTGQEQAA
ncbi:DUF2827 family protein [Novosphingobium rosa]|uniref:DUF2827 family protein n=1 Tax=Novosphingobium rosa TaxID=76978 RepID=UPI0008343490|nr:DUF2827 family protein [Novosphingobium rosa]